MLDGQIVAALIIEIENQLSLYGISPNDLRVARSFQPTAQSAGASDDSRKFQVLISPAANTNIGWSRKYKVEDEQLMLDTNHVKQKTYQISTLTDFDQSVLSDIPAQDLAQIVHDMIQQPDATKNLREKGVNILECIPVRPSFKINQSDEYESMPNFDITLSYNSEYSKPVAAIDDVTGEVYQQ